MLEKINLDDYNIYIGDFWKEFSDFLQEGNYSKFIFLVDENTKMFCLPLVLQKFPTIKSQIIEIKSGEQNKTLETCSFIWKELLQTNVDRKALLINLGGGVIGDMGGFCASTYKRGIDFIQIPTTLLSQVDASIGGKLGFDFEDVKNGIGLFRNPKAVFVFADFLQTLPLREIKSGFAELIKHSLIQDENQWKQICQIKNVEEVDWDQFIIPSIKIKQSVVEKDPFEKNIRKALNFGHTIGHAIESMALKSNNILLHGEAIAIGMICETYLSHKKLGLSLNDLELVSHFILGIYGKYEWSKNNYDDLFDLMKKDKKNELNKINFTLLPKLGNASINQNCSDELIAESLDYYFGFPAEYAGFRRN